MFMYIIYTYIYISHLYLLVLLFSSFNKLTNLFVENMIETDIMGGNIEEFFFHTADTHPQFGVYTHG